MNPTLQFAPIHQLIETDVQQGKLVGFRRLGRRPPGVVLPVFLSTNEESEKLYLYQRVDNHQSVIAFVGDPDLTDIHLLPVDSEVNSDVRVDLGGRSIHAYEIAECEIVSAQGDIFTEEIRKLVNENRLGRNPFAALEAAKFVGDTKAASKFASVCAENLANRSIQIAKAWSTNTTLTPDARKAVNHVIKKVSSARRKQNLEASRKTRNRTDKIIEPHLENQFDYIDEIDSIDGESQTRDEEVQIPETTKEVAFILESLDSNKVPFHEAKSIALNWVSSNGSSPEAHLIFERLLVFARNQQDVISETIHWLDKFFNAPGAVNVIIKLIFVAGKRNDVIQFIIGWIQRQEDPLANAIVLAKLVSKSGQQDNVARLALDWVLKYIDSRNIGKILVNLISKAGNQHDVTYVALTWLKNSKNSRTSSAGVVLSKLIEKEFPYPILSQIDFMKDSTHNYRYTQNTLFNDRVKSTDRKDHIVEIATDWIIKNGDIPNAHNVLAFLVSRVGPSGKLKKLTLDWIRLNTASPGAHKVVVAFTSFEYELLEPFFIEQLYYVVRNLEKTEVKARSLIALHPFIAESTGISVLKEALELIRTIDSKYLRAILLADIASKFEEIDSYPVWKEAANTAFSQVNPTSRVYSMAALAKRLPKQGVSEIWEDLFSEIDNLDDGNLRNKAIKRVSLYIPINLERYFWDEILHK